MAAKTRNVPFALLIACAFLVPAVAKNVEKPMLKEEYVRVNGLRLHVVTAGKGPLMLFLHGFPEFWYEWKEQLREFSKDHLVVAPDCRGFGRAGSARRLRVQGYAGRFARGTGTGRRSHL